MRIEGMLVRFVEKLLNSLGDTAEAQRYGELSVPVSEWEGRHVNQFIDRVRRATQDEYMMLGSEICRLGTSDFVIRLAARCYTLRDAINMCFRFLALSTNALKFELVEQDNLASIVIRQPSSLGDREGALADWAMIVWHKLSQWLIRTEICLDRTEFAHPLDAPYSGYAVMFGSECTFKSDAYRLVFARSYLDHNVVRTPAEAASLVATKVGYFSQPVGLTKSLKQSIWKILRANLLDGDPPDTLDQIAARLGLSNQTVRRRLREEGVGYRELKAEVRREVALDFLANRCATVGAASIAAGFAEPNSLARALRDSKGITVGELRQEVLQWTTPAYA